MLKRIGIIIVLGVLVLACNNHKKIDKPDDLISKEQMSNLLYDLYIVNAAKGVNRKILEDNKFNPEAFILAKYNMDSVQFAKSNTYYAHDSESYKAIVDVAKARLESTKEILEDLRAKETDSIKNRKDSLNEKKKLKKDLQKNRVDVKVSDSLKKRRVFNK